MARKTSILGLVQLQKKIRALPKEIVDEVKLALEAGAQEIVDMAKRLVPVGSSGRAGSKAVSRHGTLRDSIGWTWGAPPRGSITLAKATRAQLGKDLTLTVYAGNDDAFYARWVEFGVKGHSSPSPFFFPSYRANKKDVVKRVRAATRKAAKKVAKSRGVGK